ncbi:MAG: N-acetylmuramoyl-L-alanine amidase [Clostridia bacterium]|nr:N-acetylmuramoyl-L-alanine amidase [Clostridia bacterium]
MSRSPLATTYVPSPATNHYGKRTKSISQIVLHHMVAVWTALRCAESFSSESRRASATYCVGNDGSIACCLDESIAPATSDSYEVDNKSVTIETSNCSLGGDYPVSDAALNSLINLCADIAKRNPHIGKLVAGKNLCWHSMYAATACPGNYLRSKAQFIAREANKLNGYFSGELDGNDVPRGTDDLVLYFKGLNKNGRTGTNKYGYEVQIDKNGVVLEDPHYSGNTRIPAGGKVLSGHGEAGKWIYNNIRKGYLVWFSEGRTHVARGTNKSADVVNGHRATNYLAVYNTGSKAPTNMWGWEAAVNKKGHVTCVKYGGKMPIPEGGFVVSGHGTSSTWVHKNIKVGSTVTFDGKIVKVK